MAISRSRMLGHVRDGHEQAFERTDVVPVRSNLNPEQPARRFANFDLDGLCVARWC